MGTLFFQALGTVIAFSVSSHSFHRHLLSAGTLLDAGVTAMNKLNYVLLPGGHHVALIFVPPASSSVGM